MARIANALVAYRAGVLLLATAVWVLCFADARIVEFGWQFQYLDVWALSLSVLVGCLMLRRSLGWGESRHAVLAGTAAALNAVVIAIHLGPLIGEVASTAHRGASPFAQVGAPLWKSVYLYLVGPALQIADATLILGAFRQIGGALCGVAVVALSYVAWIELAVGPLNDAQDGSGGLPYAFLNAMALPERLGVYAMAACGGMLVVPALWAIQRGVRGGAPESGAPESVAAE